MSGAGLSHDAFFKRLMAEPGAAGTLLRERLPPAIVPLVVYHGRAAWTLPADFAALLAAPEPLRPFVPDFRHVLVDLGAIDDTVLSGLAVLRAGLMALKYVLREDLPHRLEAMLAPLAGQALEITITLLRYVLSGPGRLEDEELQRAIRAALPDEEARIMSTLTDQWVEQGLAKGLEQGRVEGRAQGRAVSLVRLLERRFGPLPAGARRRIDLADAETLDRWLDRVFDAADRGDIFAP